MPVKGASRNGHLHLLVGLAKLYHFNYNPSELARPVLRILMGAVVESPNRGHMDAALRGRDQAGGGARLRVG